MANIKDIPDFYERLHSLETPEITIDEDGFVTIGRYNLKDIPSDHETILSLRKDMGIVINDPLMVHVDSNDIDWEFVDRSLKTQNLKTRHVCNALGFVQSSWGRKRRNSTFTVKEIRRLEKLLKLSKASLLPLTKEEEHNVRKNVPVASR